ncbi:AI-2E family transporter [Spirosoma pollinicola]|uniref:AI-2E family transporter n=1 Tax=Spirosoma pollinicola TaxID=2057025 RepID=A0A2K8Z669_9BACT|nr:AI-2E family transporter [Spirosoma pollinicola]AUD05386.1 AI-2E family transporter [Spirosoma pollinicola]
MKQPTENNSSAFDHNLLVRQVSIILGLTLTALLLLGLLGAIIDILMLVLAAVLIALPLRAGARWLSQKTSWKEGICLAVVAILTLGLLTALVWTLSSSIGGQMNGLAGQLSSAIKQARDSLTGSEWGQRLVDAVPSMDKLFEGRSRSLSKVFGAVSSTIGLLADVYVIIFLAAFLAAQPSLYQEGLLLLVPKPGRKRGAEVLDKLGKTLLNWLIGKLFSMVVVGVLSFLGLWLLGVKMAAILSLFAGLITFIPNFGPILALVPAVLFAFSDGPQQALYVVLLYTGIQLIESNLLTPLVQNKMISMPPALVLISQLVMGVFVGGIGLILATPVMAIILVLVKMLYIQDVLEDESIQV